MNKTENVSDFGIVLKTQNGCDILGAEISMKYSKSRPKIIASRVLDSLSTLAYLALAIAMFVVGTVIINADPVDPAPSEDVSSIIAQGSKGIAQGLAGIFAYIIGIVCLGAMLFSLVGTIISITSVNKDVNGIKKSLNKLKVAEAFNYVATGIFTIGAVFDFIQSGGNTSAILGACILFVIAVFRAASGALKTLAVKDIQSEQVEQDFDAHSDDGIVLEEIDDEDR